MRGRRAAARARWYATIASRGLATHRAYRGRLSGAAPRRGAARCAPRRRRPRRRDGAARTARSQRGAARVASTTEVTAPSSAPSPTASPGCSGAVGGQAAQHVRRRRVACLHPRHELLAGVAALRERDRLRRRSAGSSPCGTSPRASSRRPGTPASIRARSSTSSSPPASVAAVHTATSARIAKRSRRATSRWAVPGGHLERELRRSGGAHRRRSSRSPPVGSRTRSVGAGPRPRGAARSWVHCESR